MAAAPILVATTHNDPPHQVAGKDWRPWVLRGLSAEDYYDRLEWLYGGSGLS